MLVLSRRPNEIIHFPNTGIKVRILRVKGRVADIGIEAPPEVKILRSEVTDNGDLPSSRPLSHELRNKLNKVTLGLHRFQQQSQSGMLAEADTTFQQILDTLEALDREGHLLDSNNSTPAGTLHPTATGNNPQKPCRTLLVEDDDNERELLAGLLSMNGCECETAADGQEALAFLESHEPPDFILLDMGLPRVSGPEVLARLRNKHRFPGTKVFAVSGRTPEEMGITTGPDGVDAWFTKPLNPRRLWEALQQDK